ncbi:outer membrane protein [Gracilimonas tropica]|uniref:outer membrane protein n=1 Tax=Gracilimonas tropica TaxID=454600 RepID=UPI0003791879|nr:outer membrane beta-barrel protein [Gracilimonas tropica]
MKRLTILTVLLITIFSAPALAQLEIGASYELRNEEPKNGFGLRIQKGIFERLPLVNLGIRLHASYFSEENNIDPQNQSYSYSRDLTNIDVGIAAIGGVSLGLLEPYVGLGLGTENYEQVINDYSGPESVKPQSGSDNNIYWNMLAGAKVTVIPLIKPFVEYRYSDTSLSEPAFENVKSQTGRIMFGVSLSF